LELAEFGAGHVASLAWLIKTRVMAEFNRPTVTQRQEAKIMRTATLKGGPHDGRVIEVDVARIEYFQPGSGDILYKPAPGRRDIFVYED
jgi:hypothetical protein